MLLTHKEKSRILLEKIKIKNTLSASVASYLLFFALLVCIVLQVHRDTSSTEKIQALEDGLNQISFDGIECGYHYTVDKNYTTAWEPFTITIRYSPGEKCVNRTTGGRLDKDGGTVLRVQVYSAYELTSATSEYVGNEMYKATLRLTIPTKYVVMIFLTYVGHSVMEDKRHVRPLLRQITGSPFELNVKRQQKKNPSVAVDRTRFCSANESGSVKGRWVKCGNIIPNLERCGPWQGPEFDFDQIHGFRWLPYECQYHTYTDDEIKRCFARNGWDSIIFAGDSHTRYRAYHWATRLYGGCTACVKTHIKMLFDKVPRIEWMFDARGTRLPLSFENLTLPNEKYIHPKVRRSKFSSPFPLEALNSKLFLLNFGHWVLRESRDREFMYNKLHAYAKAAKILINRGKTVLWVNTVSLPWRTDQAVKHWRENTSPYRVRSFNHIADKIIKQYGIPTVNAYDISDGRIAATHDQTHYTKKLAGNDFGGVVENAISNVIFNKLCNDYL